MAKCFDVCFLGRAEQGTIQRLVGLFANGGKGYKVIPPIKSYKHGDDMVMTW